MAMFYVLPSRPLLGGRLATFLRQLLPGVKWSHDHWAGLVDDVIGAAVGAADVYIIYRDELPEGVAVEDALAAGFGAEQGDEIVEITLGQGSQPASAKQRRLDAA